jgi:hypothetical protein
MELLNYYRVYSVSNTVVLMSAVVRYHFSYRQISSTVVEVLEKNGKEWH